MAIAREMRPEPQEGEGRVSSAALSVQASLTALSFTNSGACTLVLFFPHHSFFTCCGYFFLLVPSLRWWVSMRAGKVSLRYEVAALLAVLERGLALPVGSRAAGGGGESGAALSVVVASGATLLGCGDVRRRRPAGGRGG